MAKTKKKVFLAALSICLVAIISMGTLAWFSAEDRLENQFTVLDSLKDFEVDAWEIVDIDGVEESVGRDVNGIHGTTYEDVEPGVTYKKQVYVKNNSESKLADQYIKVEVTFTNYAALRAMAVDLSEITSGDPLPKFDCTTMLEGGYFSNVEANDEATWWYDERATHIEDNTATYVFYLKKVLKNTDGDECLFRGVTIPASMDINDADYLIKTNGFEVKVVAYAIQSANIKLSASATPLENAVYAFAEAWGDRDAQPNDVLYPTVTTTTTAPEYQ